MGTPDGATAPKKLAGAAARRTGFTEAVLCTRGSAPAVGVERREKVAKLAAPWGARRLCVDRLFWSEAGRGTDVPDLVYAPHEAQTSPCRVGTWASLPQVAPALTRAGVQGGGGGGGAGGGRRRGRPGRTGRG